MMVIMGMATVAITCDPSSCCFIVNTFFLLVIAIEGKVTESYKTFF